MMNTPLCHESEERRSHCPQTKEAARQAVREVFALLSVDVDQPKDVEQLREILRFAGKLSRLADHGMMAAMAAISVAILGAIWVGVTSSIVRHN